MKKLLSLFLTAAIVTGNSTDTDIAAFKMAGHPENGQIRAPDNADAFRCRKMAG